MSIEQVRKLEGYNELNHIAQKIIDAFGTSDMDLGYVSGKIEDHQTKNKYESFFWACHALDSQHQQILADDMGFDVAYFPVLLTVLRKV